MRIALCVHAGDPTDGRGPLGRLRPCAKGLHGGLVHRAGECQTCTAYAASAPDPAPRPGPARPSECAYRGPELTGPERAARGLSHAPRWAPCLHPERPLGGAVCPCKGCGPGCPGFTPEGP